MRQLKLLVACLLLAQAIARGQHWQHQFGAASAAMGGTKVHLAGTHALFNNPAGLALLKNSVVAGSFSNRYGLPQFMETGLAAAAPLKYFVAGLQVTRFGDAVFSQQKLGASMAHEIAGVRLGLRANLLQTRIQDAGSASTPSFDAGATAQLSENLALGAYIFNLGSARFTSDWQDFVPSVMSLGVFWQPVPLLQVHLEAEKDSHFPLLVKCGMQYQLADKVQARLGIIAPQRTITAGCDIHIKKWQIGYAFGNDWRLGALHQLGVSVVFPHSQKQQNTTTHEEAAE